MSEGLYCQPDDVGSAVKTGLANSLTGPSDTIVIGGIRSSRATRSELADIMAADVARSHRGDLPLPRVIMASNGSVVAHYHGNPAYREMVDRADLIDVDGMPLVMATRLLCKEPLRERVATTDFIHDACAMAVRKNIRFFFLGAEPGVAQMAADNLSRQYPGLQMAGVRHGYFEPSEEAEICAEIVAAGTDILWLGMGSPRQERFAVFNREALKGVAWIRTCGGLFDFCAERVPRAPGWMQSAGLEWLFRTWQEPSRLGSRYIMTNPIAFYHLLTKTHD